MQGVLSFCHPFSSSFFLKKKKKQQLSFTSWHFTAKVKKDNLSEEFSYFSAVSQEWDHY